MQFEKRKQQELKEREGLARRTIAQVVWLLLSAVIAYLVVRYLFDQEILNYGVIYSSLGLPGWIDEWMIQVALILIGVFIMQFFFVLGYAFASPQGRRPTGKATTRAQDPDPLDNRYRR